MKKQMMIFVMTMLFGVVGAASGNTTVSAAEQILIMRAG